MLCVVRCFHVVSSCNFLFTIRRTSGTGLLVDSADTNFCLGELYVFNHVYKVPVIIDVAWCGDFPSSGVILLASVLATIYVILPMPDTIGLSGTCGLGISGVPYM